MNRVIVSELKDSTFFAKIVLQHNGTTLEVDSRPSDAIALAVRSEAPIFVEDEVMERAGVELHDASGVLEITTEAMASCGGFQPSRTPGTCKSPPLR